MTKPKKKQKRALKNILIVCALVIAGAAVAAFTPYFNIERVEILGNSKVDTQLVYAASELETGMNIFGVKLSRISANVAKIPYVHKVDVKRTFPNVITIKVEESRAAAVIPFLEGGVLIDVYGKALERVEAEQFGEYLQLIGVSITNYDLGKKITVENEKKLKIALENIGEIVHNNIMTEIVEIDTTEIGNIKYKMNGGKLTVLMADNTNIPYKLNFLKEIMGNLGENPKGVIDFTSKDPTYRVN